MDIAITNVHLDLGAGLRGTDMGPSAIHVAGLIKKLIRQGHSIADIQSIGGRDFEILLREDNTNVRFLKDILNVCTELKSAVTQQLQRGQTPLVLGGDHSQAIGTISGISNFYKKQGKDIGVIWVDAHTDMNTPESSPSGNIHGMPLATLLGHGHPDLLALNGTSPSLKPENIAIIGARDVDSTEIPLVRELGVRVYTMSEIDRRGASTCFREAVYHVGQNTAGIHLSFDLDGIDPKDAPGVGTPVPGGLSLREAHLICELIHQSKTLIGMEMVELNPILDISNRTGELAVWLIQSTFGKQILK